MDHVIIIHGWEGSPDEGWKPWLKTKLEADGCLVDVPAMPDAAHPRQDAWVAQLARSVGTPDQHTYLVGHSLGCITILRYLEALTAETRIGGAVLVAGFVEDLAVAGYHHQLASFFTAPLKWEAIASHCPKFVAFASDNDPWVDPGQLQILASRLDADTHMLHQMGHFSGDDHMTQLPVVYDQLLALTGRTNST